MLEQDMEKHYNNLNQKLNKLTSLQHNKKRRKNATTQEQQYYPRPINLTSINFSLEQTTLLNKGFQHSIENPIDKYWTDLLAEMEQAILTLDSSIQDPMRMMAAAKLKQIRASSSQQNPVAKQQAYLITNINNNL
jgi:hypothetical protein